MQLKDSQEEQQLIAAREQTRLQFGANSPEYRAAQQKIRYFLNPDKQKAASALYKKQNRLKINAYYRNRFKTNDNARIKMNEITNAYYHKNKDKWISYSNKRRNSKERIDAERTLARLRQWIHSPRFPNFPPQRKPRSLAQLIGCSGKQFKSHIESKFYNGMSWLNHALMWHFSHVVPIRNFDCSDPEQLKLCFHFSNLIPDTIYNNKRSLNEVTTPQPTYCI